MKKKTIKKQRSKRYDDLAQVIDKNKSYTLEEAIELVKKTSTTKFDSGVEIHARLGIDPKQGDQQIRVTVSLPHGTGKMIRVAAFVMPDQEKEAKEAGADLVGGSELVEEIKQSSQTDFDIAVSTPEMMKELAKIAKVLGPRNLMPSPKNETVTNNIKKTIAELKKGKIAFKNDAGSNVHVLIGRASFEMNQLKENIEAFTDALKRAKPAAVKGTYLKSLTLTSSMGPGIKIQV